MKFRKKQRRVIANTLHDNRNKMDPASWTVLVNQFTNVVAHTHKQRNAFRNLCYERYSDIPAEEAPL